MIKDEKEKATLEANIGAALRKCAKMANKEMSFGQKWRSIVIDPIKQLFTKDKLEAIIDKHPEIVKAFKQASNIRDTSLSPQSSLKSNKKDLKDSIYFYMVQFITIPGLSNYLDTLNLMEKHVSGVINNSLAETVYLTEHSEVYTAGTSYRQNELLNPDNIPVIYTGRGGKFTFHGEGQRVIYPILNLASPNRTKDLKLYIKMLEEWLINSLLCLGIKAYIISDKVGVWVKDKNNDFAKIAAIGVRVKKWVTYHGIAINISTDLDKFTGIIPCGLTDSLVTSLTQIGVNIKMNQFDKILQTEFKKVFN